MKGRIPSLTRGELLVLAVLAIAAVAPPLAAVARVLAEGGTVTVGASPTPADQLQYMAWIRDAGEHVLASNLFEIGEADHDFLHPMFTPSGGAWKLGLPIQLAYLAWLPVAVLVLFGGFAAYVRRLVPDRGLARPLALALGLFFCTPLWPVIAPLGDAAAEVSMDVAAPDAFAAGQLWGYLPTAIALGLIPVFLLAVEGVLAAPSGARRTPLVVASAAGLLCSWLHPWQGETLLAIVAGLVVWGRFDRRYLALAGPVLATVVPLAYYFALSRLDGSWETAQAQADLPRPSLWVLLAVLGPLALPALLGLRSLAGDVQERMLRLWPVAALAVYFAAPSFPIHALEGLGLPLGILAVRGAAALPRQRLVAGAALVVLAVPGVAYAANGIRQAVADGHQPHFLRGGERRALAWLEDQPDGGGVLSTAYLGPAVPAFSGRQTWVGHPSWTPDFGTRSVQADRLVTGALDPAAARATVRQSGASYVLVDCGIRARLAEDLGPLIAEVRRFGCASVLRIRTGRGAPPS